MTNREAALLLGLGLTCLVASMWIYTLGLGHVHDELWSRMPRWVRVVIALVCTILYAWTLYLGVDTLSIVQDGRWQDAPADWRFILVNLFWLGLGLVFLIRALLPTIRALRTSRLRSHPPA